MSAEWTKRVWAEFAAGNLTRAWRDVLLTLATFRGRSGVICPSHQTLANRATLKASKTAERALHAARDLGLVEWTERRVRRGWRLVRSSNTYQLLIPKTRPQGGLRRPRTNRPAVAGGELDKKERRFTMEALNAVPRHIVRMAQHGLAEIAAARMRALGIG